MAVSEPATSMSVRPPRNRDRGIDQAAGDCFVDEGLAQFKCATSPPYEAHVELDLWPLRDKADLLVAAIKEEASAKREMEATSRTGPSGSSTT